MNPCSHRYKRSTNVFAALFALLSLLLVFPAYADTVVSGCSEAALRNALGGGGVVSFGSNCSITLAAPIALGSGTTIDAAGHQVTLSGGNAVSLFTINGSGVTLKGLTLANGRSTNGGALYINPGAVVTATNCTFANNSATGADGVAGYNGANNDTGSGGNGGNGGNGTAGLGGAIYNAGILKLLNCTLNTNSATGGKGGNGGNGGTGGGTLGVGGNGGNGGNGAPAYGGAVYNISNLTVINCSLSGNTAVGGNAGAGGTNGTGAFPGTIGKGGAGAVGSGAGIYNAKNLNVQASSFSGNIAFGGNSTAGGNQANGVGSTGAAGGDAAGGGVWSAWWGIVTNSTFINNGAVGGNGGNGGPGSGTFPTGGTGGNGGNGWGGGVHNAGTLNMVNCTVASCGAWGGTNGAAGSGTYAGSPGQMGSGLGGDIAMSAGTFTLVNSILSTNISGGNSFGAISDAGHNLSSDASLTLTAPGSHSSTNPKLGAWGMNGGPTGTMPLLAGSPAINQLSPASAPATDQRGFPRPLPLGGLSDIGAYEYEGASAPVLTQLPVDQIVVQSAPATFRVAAVGAATLRYQWRLDSVAIAGATSSIYTVANATPTNEGPYDVVVSNSLGATNSLDVFVDLAAAITAQPANQVLLPGSNATFSVTATGDALQYQWSFNSTDIPSATNSSLVITNAQTNNVGTYRVEVFNGFSTTNSANARLDLLPTILTQPADQTTVVGGNATFSAVAVGSPTLSYQWRFGGTNISGATGSSYTLTQATSTNAGTYNVVITNSVGQTNSRLARLVVNPPGFTISGQITNTVAPVQVLLLLAGVTNQTVTTDNGGNFTFVGLSAGTYTVQPIPASCRHFAPTSMPITVGPNATAANFTSVVDAYLISGQFTGTNGAGVTNILVTLTPGTGAFLTGTNGSYVFSNLCAGSYTINASAGFCSQLTPPSYSVTVGPADAINQNFVVAPNVYTVSGTIVEGAAGLGGVTIQLSGTNSVLTDGNGNYTLTNICPGTYTITPVLPCQRFSPTNRVITLGPSLTQVNFTGYTNDVFSIWGRVVTTNGVDGLAGVSIRAGDRTATTDANGYYVLSNICPGTNQVVPTLAGYGFTPAVSNVNVVADTSGVNFLAYPSFTVSGSVYELLSGNTNPLVGVTVQLTGGGTNATVLTDANGIYSFSSLVSNIYTVTPSLSCYLFTPTNQTVSPTNTQANFQGTNDAVHTIAGNISAGATGLGNITVQLTGPELTNTVNTDASGNYRFTNLCSAVYTVTPTQSCMLFYPPNHVVTLTPTGPDAIATDFSGYQESLTIRGQVVAAIGGAGVPGVAVSVAGQTNLTDVNGYFVFANLCSGAYTVQPLLTGYLFGPPISFLNLVSDTNVNFTAFPVLAISRATNGLPQVRFGAGAGLAYQLQVSTNLSSTNWQTILVTNNVSSQAALLQFIDSDSRSFPQRFFRIAEVPWLVLHRGTNGLLQVSFVANSGATTVLQASSDLANWQNVLTTNVPVWPISIQFTEPTNYPNRFYRLHP